MSLMKNFSFGKKKGAHDQDTAPAGSPNEQHVDYDDGLIEEINESVAGSLSHNLDHVTPPDDQAHHDIYPSEASGESIGASSTDMSADSIATSHQEEVLDAGQPKTMGIGEKMRAMFSGKKEPFMDEPVIESDPLNLDSSAVERQKARTAEIINAIGAEPRALPLIGKMKAKSQYKLALTLMTVALMSAGYLSITSLLSQSELKGRSNNMIKAQLATQSLTLTAQNLVIRSESSAAGVLSGVRNSLKEANEQISKDTANQHAAMVNKLINESIFPVIDRALKIGSEIGAITRQVGVLERNTSESYRSADQLVSYLQATSSSKLAIAAANDMRVRSERMRTNGIKMLTANALTLAPLGEFAADHAETNKVIAELLADEAGMDETAKKLLSQISDANASIGSVNIFLQKYATAIVQSRIDVSAMREAVGSISLEGANYVKDIENQSDVYSKSIVYALILLGLGVAFLGLLSLINSRLTKIEAWSTAHKNKNNELDIMEFMGDVYPLENGDLTSSFTRNIGAMEGITGGIRSSVNEAVISLRDAMGMVKDTTGSVMTNVSESVGSSRDLQLSNDRQSKEIEGVMDRVVSLASAIQEVTDNTVLAVQMTSSSKAASDAGALVVGQTNEKMFEIRTNMQDVLKSVKHLGETSHEIGTIVEAIENITDRTQVIAVNASLEAAKAGAAGKGFQVLAGEVNRLAEQSNESLRTIIALVQRIQGETAAAIRVVEDSTNNVVEGAKLSESAKLELTKISTLSVQLQDVMTTIRAQSESQSSSAGEVRESMNRLNTLSSQFQTTVSQVVTGVLQIDASMGTLQSTVSIFTTNKQPDEVQALVEIE